MAESIAGLLWQVLRLIRECRRGAVCSGSHQDVLLDNCPGAIRPGGQLGSPEGTEPSDRKTHLGQLPELFGASKSKVPADPCYETARRGAGRRRRGAREVGPRGGPAQGTQRGAVAGT